MSDGHWAPKSDFLNNSRSCGFINNLGSGGGFSGSGTTTSSSNYSGSPPGATSCHQQQNNGVVVGQQQQVINNSTTTAQQPRVATSLDALLADLDQLTGGLPDLGSRRQQPAAVDSWGNSHNNNSRSNGGAKSCGEVGRKNSALQKSEIEVKMPATNSINIQLTAPPSKPPSNIGPDRRRHEGRNGNDGRADNGRSYEDDLDYLLEKGRDGSPHKEGAQPYHSRYDSKPFSYIRQNPSKPNSRLHSRASSREALDSGKSRELESPSLLRRILKGTAGGGGGSDMMSTPPDSPLPPYSTASNSRQQSISPISWNSKVQPDWVLNQTCSDQQQNTWNKSSATSYKQSTADHNSYNHKSADQRQNGGNFNQNGANLSHSTTNFQQTENIYSRIGQPLNGGGYGQNNRAGSLDRVNLDSGGLQERVIPVQIERESRATERSSRQQERSLGGTQSGLMRSHSLGRHEYNGERFGSRQTIQIQTRDKSAYGRIGSSTNGLNNGGTSSHMNGSHGASNGYRQQSASADRYGQSHGGSSSSSNGGMSRTEADRNDWLQRQQRKLLERKNSGAGRSKSSHMVQELKSSFVQIGRSEPSDGYASDANSFHISDTSRESSPSKVFNIPVQIESRAVPQNNVHTVHRPVQSNQPIITSSMNNKSRMEEVDNTSIYSSVKKQLSISRQMSENSYDRSRPCLQPRNRHESESEAELEHFRNGFSSSMSINGSRPETPGFPVTGTPLFNQSTNTLPPKSPGLFGSRVNSRFDLTGRSGSPAGSMYQGDNYFSSRRGSVSSEPTDVPHNQVKLVRDNHKFWYKKDISRDEAISILNTQPPGTFIVRDSNSFPGAFGLALKVATPPPNKGDKDGSSELVRHFLIEPTSKGVKLKGYSNEPVFASLSALIYQHTVTPLALPCKLVIPSQDIGGGKGETGSPEMTQLLQYGAACNVYYLFTQDTDLLTGPQAMRKTVSQLILTRPVPVPTTIHFKVSGQGITLTDQSRRLFFRKHYPVTTISHCGVDPEDRRWNLKSADKSTDQSAERSLRIFGFVARKTSSSVAGNQCHVFAELDADQPARAIVNFVNKLMAISQNGGQMNNRHADMV